MVQAELYNKLIHIQILIQCGRDNMIIRSFNKNKQRERNSSERDYFSSERSYFNKKRKTRANKRHVSKYVIFSIHITFATIAF